MPFLRTAKKRQEDESAQFERILVFQPEPRAEVRAVPRAVKPSVFIGSLFCFSKIAQKGQAAQTALTQRRVVVLIVQGRRLRAVVFQPIKTPAKSVLLAGKKLHNRVFVGRVP